MHLAFSCLRIPKSCSAYFNYKHVYTVTSAAFLYAKDTGKSSTDAYNLFLPFERCASVNVVPFKKYFLKRLMHDAKLYINSHAYQSDLVSL